MVEIPAAASSEGGGDARKVTLKLPQAPPCFTDVIVLKDASIGWRKPEDSQGQAKPLLSNVELTIKKKQRVLVLGPNGSGKSTLLKALSGSLPLWSGTRREGEGVRIATFSQDLAQDLPSQQPALSYVEDVARAHDPTVTMERCRQALGALGLTGSMALAQIGALREFQGAIVAITHNRAFAESLNATHILRVENGRAKLGTNMGLSDADFEHSTSSTPAAAAPAASAAAPASAPSSSGSSSRKGSKSRSPTPGVEPAKGSASSSSGGKSKSKSPTPAASSSSNSSSSVAAKPKPRQLSWKEQQEYQKLDACMKVMTQKRDELQEKVTRLASNGKDLKAMEAASLELGTLAEELDELEMRWLELAEIAGDI
ncbi:P-loop containing nucleoside triphosphate hydrolase protein [Dunaliella salina]|uniref:P-loop containing nucleoside triphosphate hydrolase protein n=1 Tax=Dunaliella salina TaxID=3046 RepID=A0ABQ7GUI6_DUNSA|nr:P-loop containing nucleoside triphosphate hydrolase protein [Dunaliella salina]|eukprot:KAF5838243.1 P-loop containing nucleoside triphosphate hydrolase protein [Dunaliella salina]